MARTNVQFIGTQPSRVGLPISIRLSTDFLFCYQRHLNHRNVKISSENCDVSRNLTQYQVSKLSFWNFFLSKRKPLPILYTTGKSSQYKNLCMGKTSVVLNVLL